MKTMSGAEIVINCLLEQGIDACFGYPGGKILDIYDQLYLYQDKINHYLAAHEQGAAHAADGYARSTGKVGVCMATSGPGATNLVTGIANAYLDSIPIVCITANVPTKLIGTDAFQEVDIVGVTMPITKHNAIVRDVNELASTLRKAFQIAKSGRPGPVLIDIPLDILKAQTEYQAEPTVQKEAKTKTYSEKDITDVAKTINQAEKPVLLIGGGAGISGAEDQIKDLAKKLKCPVVSSLMALGVYDSNDEQFFGMLGMHGLKAANLAMVRSDLVINIGSRLSDRVASGKNSFGKDKKIIQIDIDKAEIDKNLVSFEAIQGDAKEVLDQLNPLIKQKEDNGEIAELRKLEPAVRPQFNNQIFSVMQELAPDDMIVTDVGQHQMWTAQYFPFNHYRQLLTSGGAGTMGFSLGASIGAKVGNPDKQVTTVIGDGCFGMNCNELATINRYSIPLIIVLVNNGVLGMVRQWQTLYYENHYSNTTLGGMPKYDKLAEAYNLNYAECKDAKEFKKAYQAAQKANKATIINCYVGKDENVVPMAKGGAEELDKFILE